MMNLKSSFLLLALSAVVVEAKVRGGVMTPNRRSLTSRHSSSSGTGRQSGLPEVMGYGAEPYTPLDLCEGDCDNDSDCRGALQCCQRSKYQNAPGCSGGTSFGADTDFCAPPGLCGGGGPAVEYWPVPAEPAVPAQERPMIEYVPVPVPVPVPAQPQPQPQGAIIYLEFTVNMEGWPLGLCQGDCDTDDDCLDDFVCFQRDMFENVPGCLGTGEASIDYCTKVNFGGQYVTSFTPAPQPPPQTPGGFTMYNVLALLTQWDESLGLPLGLCEGDCDTDDDCLDNLICFQRDLLDPVPGCSGSGWISYDYCIRDPFNPPAPTLPPMPPIFSNLPQPTLEYVSDNPAFMSLGLCQGDCDTDTDCAEDYVCFQRDMKETVPGCSGEGWMSYDYCMRNPNQRSGIINGQFCPDALIVGFFCNVGAPEGMICANEGQLNQAYCSYGVGANVCATCATAPLPAPLPVPFPVPAPGPPMTPQVEVIVVQQPVPVPVVSTALDATLGRGSGTKKSAKKKSGMTRRRKKNRRRHLEKSAVRGEGKK